MFTPAKMPKVWGEKDLLICPFPPLILIPDLSIQWCQVLKCPVVSAYSISRLKAKISCESSLHISEISWKRSLHISEQSIQSPAAIRPACTWRSHERDKSLVSCKRKVLRKYFSKAFIIGKKSSGDFFLSNGKYFSLTQAHHAIPKNFSFLCKATAKEMRQN